MPVPPLPPAALCRRCRPDDFPFATTRDLEAVEVPLGQERAAEALRFAAAVRRDGYNVFALGPTGLGKHGLVVRTLSARAASEPTPTDWCYLNDFDDPQKPRAVALPAGRAVALRRDLDRLIDELREALPAVFESEDYRGRVQMLEKRLQERREQALGAIQKRAGERGVAVLRTPMGFGLAPLRNGEVLDPGEFAKLPAEEQERVQRNIAELHEELQTVLRSMPQLEREHREELKALNREVALFAAGHLIDEVRKHHADLPAVVGHLDAIRHDVVENVHEFLATAESEDTGAQIRRLLAQTPAFHRYKVNALVDHGGQQGAPVVCEDLPTIANLFGRMEHHAHFGTLVTDFTLLRAGALHRANGGYLVLDARRLLTQPFAWDQLKRALRAREVRIEPPERLMGLSTVASLEPSPIPLDVKVVLVGERFLYHLLAALDPEFPELFKVAADFEESIPRGMEGDLAYARLVATVARDEGLRPFDRGAVARVVEQGARLVEDAERVSVHMRSIADLLREADHCAAQAGREAVTRTDVQAAVDARLRRAGRVRERVLEEIARGTILIDTTGAKVGQVNGLSVVQLGDNAFGRPTRITARVRLGRGEVVDIEREVELGGPIHSKGVLILAGFLGARFSGERPFSLSASLVFEQSYSGVEGDSASSAELYALLSALSGLPIRQSLAVTGSVNQLGQVQAIGGVNEKIEGFFDVCRARGLTGAEGVIIPASNVKHLMLRADVVEAAAEGQFHVYTVESVDQGIEILTATVAGEPDASGSFPEGTVNGRVAARLEALAQAARAFSASPAGKDTGR